MHPNNKISIVKTKNLFFSKDFYLTNWRQYGVLNDVLSQKHR